MNSLEKSKKKSSFFSSWRMPHAFTMLFGILIFFGILSLVLSYTSDGYYKEDGTWMPIIGSGILDWIQAIPVGFLNAIWIILFLFVLGGFINVIVKSQALEALIGKIATKFHADYKKIPLELKNQNRIKYYSAHLKEGFRQTWVIIPLMFFFSFAGTTYGMAEESLAFYAIIIPLALAAGFDLYTGFLIVFVGAGVGVMGSTINPFSVLAAVSSTKDAGVKISSSDGAAWRWTAWLFFTFVTIVFVMFYAAKVKQNKDNSALKDLFKVHEKAFSAAAVGSVAPVLTKRRLITCLVFVSVFIFMTFSMLQYGDYNDPSSDWGMKRLNNFEKDHFTNSDDTSWFHNNKITGAFDEANIKDSGYILAWTFGQWYFGALIAYFFIASLIVALINRKSERNYINEMIDGAKDMVGVAFAVGIARAIPVLLKATQMEGYFVSKVSDTIADSKGDKNITLPLFTYILCVPLTFIIPSTSGLASTTFPILSPVVNSAQPDAVSGTITAYAWSAGFANLFVPTYGVVIGALALAKIPYSRFLKAISKYLILMFTLGVLMIVLGGLAGPSVF